MLSIWLMILTKLNKQDNFILLKFVLNLHRKKVLNQKKKYDLYQQIKKLINTDIISN